MWECPNRISLLNRLRRERDCAEITPRKTTQLSVIHGFADDNVLFPQQHKLFGAVRI
jgi:hypothetical protein